MTFPVVVTGNLLYGYAPPILSAAGNYYSCMGDDSNVTAVYRSTDPTKHKWFKMDGVNGPSEVATHLSSYSDGSVIHIATMDSATYKIRYHRYNITSDTWEIIDHEVDDVSGAQAPSTPWVDIAVSDDEVVIVGSGLKIWVPTDPGGAQYHERSYLWHSSPTGNPSFSESKELGYGSSVWFGATYPSVAAAPSGSYTWYAWRTDTDTIYKTQMGEADLDHNPSGFIPHSPRTSIPHITEWDDAGTRHAIIVGQNNEATSEILGFAGTGDADSIAYPLSQYKPADSGDPAPKNEYSVSPAVLTDDGNLHVVYLADDNNIYITSNASNGLAPWSTPRFLATWSGTTPKGVNVKKQSGKVGYVYQVDTEAYLNERYTGDDVVVAVSGATETDSAQAVGLCLQADISVTLEATGTIPVNVAEETESAYAVTPDVRTPITVEVIEAQSVESAVLVIVRPIRIPVVAASETDIVYVIEPRGPPLNIIDIDLDDDVYNGQSAVIHGVSFGLVQGEVRIGAVAQTITNWTDTEITITVGGVAIGADTLYVRRAG